MNLHDKLQILRELFDSDRLIEVISTLGKNKSRTMLTAFGIFWGIFMLILLLGGGMGLEKLLMNNFSGFSSNAAIIVPKTTALPYKGYDKGRDWHLAMGDVLGMKHYLSEAENITPVCINYVTGKNGKHTSSITLKGIEPDYLKIEEQKIKYGRTLNDNDIRTGRKVCVIGKNVWTQLFPDGSNPCGKYIEAGGVYFEVVGVDVRSSNIGLGGRAENSVIVPLPVMQRIYNTGGRVDMICITGRKGVTMATMENRIREYLYHAHSIAPGDNEAMIYFNMETFFQMFQNLFHGINILVWLIGIGTVLSGVIGVTNIMLVSIRERTVELGIRRAIGAKPRDIVAQILMESGVMTITAGLSGITAAVAILAFAEPMIQKSSDTTATFQIPFSFALGAAIALLVLGLLAGIFPSLRALTIRPVDAMRDE